MAGGLAHLSPAAWRLVLDQSPESLDDLLLFGDGTRAAMNGDRAVVHGMVARRPAEHQAVQQRGRDAHQAACGGVPEKASCWRAVQEQHASDATVRHREDHWAPAAHSGDMTERRLIEDGTGGCNLIAGPARLAPYSHPRGRLSAAGRGRGLGAIDHAQQANYELARIYAPVPWNLTGPVDW